MAPALSLPKSSAIDHLRQIARSLFSTLTPRSPGQPPAALTSILALIGRQKNTITSRGLSFAARTSAITSRDVSDSRQLKTKRQIQIPAIPATYVGLYAGPAPAAVVGITLGAIFGFLLALWLVYTIIRFSGRFGGGRIVEEEVITRRHARSRSRSESRSETIEIRSEHRSPPRRTRRTEEIIVEERISREPEPPDDDIVEVIEEHSPERKPNRRESKRMSGFRTVDPAEFGGGNRPMRKVSKR